MNKAEIDIVRHGTRWILDGKELMCPECHTREPNIRVGEYDIDKIKRNDEVIGLSVTLKCPECFCVFSINRLFEKDNK